MSGASTERLVVSLVSHKQATIVADLLSDIAAACDPTVLTVLVTINVEETLNFRERDFPFDLRIVRNAKPKGFGANHNAAFSRMSSKFFCVLNPDIRLNSDPFPPLLAELRKPNIGIVSPLIIDPSGKVEDNARRVITPMSIARRLLKIDKEPDYHINELPISPDWVAGMFMLFRSDAFSEMKGFDERFFMYCEDADICARFWRSGYGVSLVPSVAAIHHAQRKSHRNVSHVRWHIASLLRFFSKYSLDN